ITVIADHDKPQPSGCLLDARKIINYWQQDYNKCRPHSALNYQMPSEFAA
ncbi:transposase, partial [Shigella sonnei]